MSQIGISKIVAQWLVQYGKNLVEAGIGTDWDPLDDQLPELVPGGLVDQVNMEEHELFDWVNSMLNLAKTVAGILAKILQEDAENVPPIDVLLIGGDNEI